MPIFASFSAASVRSYGLVRRPSVLALETYTVSRIFTETASWVVPSGVSQVDYLVVAGGGGGAGLNGGGGGGAGGYLAGTSYPVTPGTIYTIAIGADGQRDPTSYIIL